MEPRDDAELMRAWIAGDAAAFDRLYARHRGPLYRFLVGRVRDRAVADELFQETWARVLRARRRYRPRARFSTWLLQIAHNLAIDHHRKAHADVWAEGGDERVTRAAAPADDGPEAATSRFQEHRRLQRAIELLPDAQRTALLLRLEFELPLAEVAAVTGVGRETAKSRLRYAFARLREELTP